MKLGSDRLDDGRRLKALTVVDDFTRESVDIALDPGMSSHYAMRILEDTLAALRDSLLSKLISGELRIRNTKRFEQAAAA